MSPRAVGVQREDGGAARAEEIPCFVLAGGLGTRLRAVEARPKALVPVAGAPFILFLVRALLLQGFVRVHFLLGHGSEQVEELLAGRIRLRNFDPRYDPRLDPWLDRVRARMRWTCHREPEPMGTGGALARVRGETGDRNLVLNGDSFVEILYGDLLALVGDGGQDPTASLVALWETDRSAYGGLELDSGHRVRAFVEKGVADPGWINGGAYAFSRQVWEFLPDGPSSLERDVLPLLAREGRLAALPRRCFFRDIGTPERLAQARGEMTVWVRRMEDGGEL